MADMNKKTAPIIAVCGKGGVGKTVFSALLARALAAAGVQPLLLVDADPVGGLTSAIGERAVETLSGVRERVINAAKVGGVAAAAQAAEQLEYFVFKALIEREGYSLLAMGHNTNKGCFCPANKLLRSAIETLIGSFNGVIIDAEAGIEQINRDVTGRVDRVIVVVDGSQRSLDTLRVITEMLGAENIAAVANRAVIDSSVIPVGVEFLGVIPEDEELKQYDREGRPLWQLPETNAAVAAVRAIGNKLGV
ncbi:MAG: AAA family ATPase [Bacillota bacterium]